MADQFNILDNAVRDGEFFFTSGGESALDRGIGAYDNAAVTSQQLILTYFTAKKTEPITQVRVRSGGTAAGATPSLVRVGIWTVAADDSLTALVANTASDTALLATQNTAYAKALAATWSKQAGQRYAAGLLVVSAAAMPTIVGRNPAVSSGSGIWSGSPKLNGVVSSQADLPSTVAAGSIAATTRMYQFEFLP